MFEILKRTKKRENKEYIFYGNEKIIGKVLYWISREGWEEKDFASFMKLIGINPPLGISESCEETFKCIDYFGEEKEIVLTYESQWSCNKSQIWILDGNITTKYAINSRDSFENNIPKVNLLEKKVKKEEKVLTAKYYNKDSITYILKIDRNHELVIEIYEPREKEITGNKERKTLINTEKVENFLLRLDNSLVASQVYCTLKDLIEFSEKEISMCPEILVSHVRTDGKHKQELTNILVRFGKVYEYGVMKDGNIYKLYINKDWKYSSKQADIEYIAEKDTYKINLYGGEDDLLEKSAKELVLLVKGEVAKIRKTIW